MTAEAGRAETAKYAAMEEVRGAGWVRSSESAEVARCVLSADGNSAYVEVLVHAVEPRSEEVLLEWLDQDQAWTALTSGQTGLLWTSPTGRLGTVRCALAVSEQATAATVTFAGHAYRFPVMDGYCLFVAYDVPEEFSSEWPTISAVA